MSGYQFFAGGHLVTVFSATNYAGICNNDGALLEISASLFVTPKAGSNSTNPSVRHGARPGRLAIPANSKIRLAESTLGVHAEPEDEEGEVEEGEEEAAEPEKEVEEEPEEEEPAVEVEKVATALTPQISVKRTKKAGPTSKRTKLPAPSAEPVRRSTRNK